MTTPIVDILWRLQNTKKSGDGWVAQCPAHDDKHASLSVGTGREGKLLLHCHAGCTFESIVSVLGLDTAPATTSSPRRVIETTYAYHDEHGTLLYQVVRFRPKDFRQRRPAPDGEVGQDPDALAPRGWIWNMKGVRKIPYRLPGVLEAVAAGRQVYVVEGEKDVENLAKLGLVATCNVGGAGKWRREYSEFLRAADVVILPDNDKAGEDHAAEVAASLRGVAASTRVVHLPGLTEHGDVSDWVTAGGTREQLAELVAVDAAIVTAAPGVPEGWQQQLVWKQDARGNPVKLENCLSNAVSILTEDPRWDGVYWLDEFAQEITVRSLPPYETNGTEPHAYDARPLRDDDYTRAASWLQREFRLIVGVETVAQAIGAVTMRKTFHPVREYLTGLTWDGTERLSHWLDDHCGAQDDPAYVRAVSRAWMISAVARVMQPGCKADHVLILEGPQGGRKSTLFRALATPWFTDEIDTLGSKDAGMQVQGAWIIELSELDALSRSEVTRTKAFLSKSFDRFRPPYGRTVVRFDRQCVFAGTVNHTEYLRDETGNRRFWPVRCHDDRLDVEGLAQNRDQLWAEALVAYRAGEVWWLSGGVERAAQAAQAERAIVDAWDVPIRDYLEELPNAAGLLMRERTAVTVTDLMKKALNLPVEKQGLPEQRRVVSSLVRLGWVRKNVHVAMSQDGTQVREWKYVKAPTVPVVPELDAENSNTGTTPSN